MKSNWSVLSALVERAAEGELARDELRALIESTSHTLSPQATTLLAFARALARRDEELHSHSNLYLRQFEVPQIELFELALSALPPVAEATRMVHDQMVHRLRGVQAGTLVSLGCGLGLREADIVREVRATALDVFLVEPNEDCLEAASRAVAAAAAEVGTALTLHPTLETAERLSPELFGAIGEAPSPRAVMASYALHHMADLPAVDARGELFHSLFAAGADFVCLAEPNSDHRVECLRQRFENTRRHFGQAFRWIDEQPITDKQKATVKLMFFGRELEDILGRDEGRVERHEPFERWVSRVASAGFRPAGWTYEIAPPEAHGLGPHALGHGDGDDPLVAVISGERAFAQP